MNLNFLANILRNIINKYIPIKVIQAVLFPYFCLVCNKQVLGKGICSTCYLKLKFASKYCVKCGYITDQLYKNYCNLCYNHLNKKYYFDSINYATAYNDIMYQLIYNFKKYDNLFYVDFLTNLLKLNVSKKNYANIDIIIPIPTHWRKVIFYKKSHTAVLAKSLSKKLNIPFNPEILLKNKFHKNQVGISRKERLSNIKNSFSIKNTRKNLQSINNRHILLIDDVLTTGATVNECCSVLKRFGARVVDVAVISRVDGRINL